MHRHFGICRRIRDEQDMHWRYVVHAVVSFAPSFERLKFKIVSYPDKLCAHIHPPYFTIKRFRIRQPDSSSGELLFPVQALEHAKQLVVEAHVKADIIVLIDHR